MVEQMLVDYVEAEYMVEVSVGDEVFMSPLLPVRKPNGKFRLTNDYRHLNTYFRARGVTPQVDVWRKMWELNPTWRVYMEIDLKDGFLSVPVDDVLSSMFGFS